MDTHDSLGQRGLGDFMHAKRTQRMVFTYLRSIIFTFSAPKQHIYNRNQPPGPLSPAFNCRIKNTTPEGQLAKKRQKRRRFSCSCMLNRQEIIPCTIGIVMFYLD